MSHFHAVRFYDSADSLCGIVAAFLGAGFIRHESALVIATPEHGSGITAALRAVNFSPEALQQTRSLMLLDARTTLAAIMVRGTPDPVRFESVAGAAVDAICRAQGQAVRAYDEMTDVLWRDNLPQAAIRLEALWDRLALTHGCSLLCGHGAGDCGRHGGRQSLVAQHSHVLADNGIPHPVSAV
jgi:MEDS: MEthanogen/methylotroph, DcmR Sensory domain